MDVAAPESPSGTPEQVSAAPERPGHWLRGAGLALGFVAIMGGLWLWSHPTTFDGYMGDEVGADSWTVNKPFYVGLTYARTESHGSVTIVSGRPHSLSPGGAATTDFFVCTLDPDASIGGIGAASESSMGSLCSSLVPADGVTISLGAKPLQVMVMKVTPTRAGQTVRVKGADITYRSGWQRGTQHLGNAVRIHTTGG